MISTNRRLSFSLVLLAAAVHISPNAAEARADGIRDVPELEGLSARWEGAMDSLGVPGFTVAVIKDGKLLAIDGFGKRDLKGRPATPDTMYYIASCTKTYTAMGIAMLAEQGRINLDAPVRDYLPQFRLADEAMASSLTLRELLSHAPGINSDAIVYQDAYTGQITDEAFFRLLADVTPTGVVSYSNVHYTILGRVIESVTGENWRDWLRGAVYEPLGMDRTTAWASVMYGDADAAEPMAELDGVWQRSPLVKTDRTMHAAGGMGTTARDAATWIMYHLNGVAPNGTRLVSSDMLDGMHTQQARLPEPRGRIRAIEGFGLAWFTGTYRGLPYRQHGGGYLGAAAHFSFLPEHDLGVVVLANAAGSGHALCDIVSIDVYDRLRGDIEQKDLLPNYEKQIGQYRDQQRGFDASAGNPAADGGLSLEVQRYLGTYANPTFGTVAFALEQNRLVGRIGDLTLHLRQALNADAFETWVAPGMESSGLFAVDAETGAVVGVTMEVMGQEAYFEKVR